jgi:apolipoprotein N-acyltransferase
LAIPEFELWALAWVGLVPLTVVVERCTNGRQAFLLGWLAGFVTNLGGLSWIVGLLERYDSLARPWAALVYVLFCAYQGLVFALFAAVLKRLSSRLTVCGRSLPLVLLAPLTMVASELVLPFVFPWNLAMTQAFVPRAIQLAELTGPTGVTALLMVSNGALSDALVYRKRRIISPVLALLVVAAALGFGEWRMAQVEASEHAAPKLKVGVVQGNIGFAEHGRDHHELAASQLASLQYASKLLEQRGAQLILWSETVYPYPLPQGLTSDLPERVAQRIRRGFTAPLIFGASSFGGSYTPGAPLRNSAFLLDREGYVGGRYDKNELVAFGERVPFDDAWPFLQKLRLKSAGEYEPGREVSSFPVGNGDLTFRVAPLICLEDIFSSMGQRLGALHPHLLVNLTNDAWFGPTSEPAQHLALSVFRSVEQRVAMVRAVNTGPSAFISASGRVLAKTERMRELDQEREPEVLDAEVALLEGGHTWFARLGQSFAYTCMSLVLLGLLLTRLPGRGVLRRPPQQRSSAG